LRAGRAGRLPRRAEGGAAVIAALAVAVLGLMAAVGAILLGLHRMTK
jgi:hypothetical protein